MSARPAAWLVACALAPSVGAAQDALVLGTIAPYIDDVAATLRASGAWSQVDTWNGALAPPSAGDLAPYEVVLLQADAFYRDASATGDALADHVDAGGAVVAPTLDWAMPGPAGRLVGAGYLPLGVAVFPGLDDRVATLPAGLSPPYVSGAYNALYPPVAAGAAVLARYDDGDVLIAAWRPSGAGAVVAVNDYVVSGAVGRPDFWDPASGGAALWAHVGLLAAGLPVPFSLVATGTCGGPATIAIGGGADAVAVVTGSPGAGVVPAGPCRGLALPVSRPRLLGLLQVDAAGAAAWRTPVLPTRRCGLPIVAIDLGTCALAAATLP